MLCDHCKKNQASVHSVTIVNGVKQEHYLCAECAKGVQFTAPSLMDVLTGFYSQPELMHKPDCSCGSGMRAFQQTGLLGCPDCYTAYRSQLLPVIKRAQSGRLRHVGRRPSEHTADIGSKPASAEPAEQAAVPQSEAERLRSELQKAIAQEEYERAAELRDRIRAIERKEDADNA